MKDEDFELVEGSGNIRATIHVGLRAEDRATTAKAGTGPR